MTQNLNVPNELQRRVLEEGMRRVRKSCPKMDEDKLVSVVNAWLAGTKSVNGVRNECGIAPQTAAKAVAALKKWTPRRRSQLRGKEELQQFVDKQLDLVEAAAEDSGVIHPQAKHLVEQAAKLGGHYEPDVSVVLQETHLRMTGDLNVHGGQEGAAIAAAQMRERLAAQRQGLTDPHGVQAELPPPEGQEETEEMEIAEFLEE